MAAGDVKHIGGLSEGGMSSSGMSGMSSSGMHGIGGTGMGMFLEHIVAQNRCEAHRRPRQ